MTDRSTRVLRTVRRVIVFVVGATVTLFGVLLVVTPGPAFIVVPLGLMILATEFAWARVVLVWVKTRIARMRSRKPETPEEPPAASGGVPASGTPGDEEAATLTDDAPAAGSESGGPPHER